MRRGAAFPETTTRAAASALAVLAAAGALAGCVSAAAPPTPTAASTASAGPATSEPRAQLAALAAAAQDRRYTAMYTLSTPDRPERTVVVTTAGDGDWRVDIPGGALGGTADVAVARTPAGLFQCGLPSAQRPVQASCVRVAGRDGRLPARADPRVHHPFTDWIDVLGDRRAPLSVSTTRALPNSPGSCFAVEPTSASIDVPLDAGIYCFAEDGLLTGARLGFGTLTLFGDPGTAPAGVTLPGPVVDGEPLGMASPPPPPTPSAMPSGSTGTSTG